MGTREMTVYTIDELKELSFNSYQHAIEEMASWEGDDTYWSEYIIDDFVEICEIMGIDLDYRGKKPAVWWSGFASQGDGACFEGRYAYAKGSAKKIRQYAGQDKELHRIADELQDIQRRYFYGLSATIKHVGRYCHENSVRIDVRRDTGNYYDTLEDTGIEEALRDLMHWLYRALEREYDYRTGEECAVETARANEWLFDEDGLMQ